MEKYCDIVPHADGWTYILNGVESECAFHTYELAVAAAKSRLAMETRQRVFRRRELNGDMLPVRPVAFPQAPFAG